MFDFWRSVLAIFAAVGFYTVLHVLYELVAARLLRMRGSAELTLYGDGCDAASEQLIRAALRVRRQYLPGMSITFVEIGNGQGQNVAKHMAARQGIMYLE
ncbi:MAG: hypothetical protein Q4D31_07730 [Eubacteriales bacterium]|nr:hypothetical protein [Eubacteriales bacterium]